VSDWPKISGRNRGCLHSTTPCRSGFNQTRNPRQTRRPSPSPSRQRRRCTRAQTCCARCGCASLQQRRLTPCVRACVCLLLCEKNPTRTGFNFPTCTTATTSRRCSVLCAMNSLVYCRYCSIILCFVFVVTAFTVNVHTASGLMASSLVMAFFIWRKAKQVFR
jgi:hypothetical protein